ncbi:MAG TPA: HAD-IC family P-type ATPase [Candidatus Cloacimonadota bacterium]|nr:HAD-IC family P-type ATPase [Candidatus Cloacimonadota bacterium]
MKDYSNLKQGLTTKEVEEKLKREGYNELPGSKTRNICKLILDVLSEPMFILLVACAVIYFFLGDLQEAVVLTASVFIVISIELFQERKTEKALEALKNLSSPRALVIRNGEQIRIPGREVVTDDLIILAEGDRIPADAYLLENDFLTVDESLLTGESVPVRKRVWDKKEKTATPGGDDLPFVYSGTLVVSGRGIAQVFATGERTELGKIGKSLETITEEETKLSKETGRLVKYFAIVALLICTIVVIVFYLTRKHLINALLTGITLAMSVLPEEFPVVLTVFMALGAWRMSQKNVLVRRLQAIESLGSATVLCTDKTGTITYNKMTLQKIVSNCENIDIKTAKKLSASIRNTLIHSVLGCMREPFDPMEKAIHTALNDIDPYAYADIQKFQEIKEYPLTDELRAMAKVWSIPDKTHYLVSLKGSPEAVITLCHISQEETNTIMNQVSAMAEEGLRVLGIAFCEVAPNALPEKLQDLSLQYLGLIGLADPIREAVPEAVKVCYQAGIRIIMITGDYIGTAKAIGKQIGLKNINNVISGSDLDQMMDNELAEKCKDVSIFARVVPHQKLRIVQALKATGEIVAMTGDGVNDAPALKAANIGISMGLRGTDVAREASAMVLTDDDFSSIVSAIRMGRRIYDNLRKSFTYVFSLHIPIAGMAMIPAAIADYPIIYFPVHIAFLELIIDPACSIVFEMEKEEDNIMERPPRSVNESLFGIKRLIIGALQGISVLILLILMYFGGINIGMGENHLRAHIFTTLVFSNLMLITTNRSWQKNLFQIIRTPNKGMTYLFLGVFAIVLLMTQVPSVTNIFHFESMSVMELLTCLILGNLSVAWFEIYKLIANKKLAKQHLP